jgi:hypothetical protein
VYKVLRVLLLVLALLAVTTSLALAAGEAMPTAPDWGYFWGTVVGSGAIVLILVDFLIVTLPAGYGAWLKAHAGVIVAVLTALCPQIANAVLTRWPSVDPVAWTILYLLVPWAIHQLLYALQKRGAGELLPKRE